MTKKEKALFKALCSFKEKDFDESLLKYANSNVLGLLFFNRMQTVAYGVLCEHNLLSKVNREFRTSLEAALNISVQKTKSYIWCVKYLENLFSNYNFKYAMLKGAYLCSRYPMGYRTSNDIDILVHPKDVTEIGDVLTRAGFMQGYIKNNKFVPATRIEIITSKMTRGETVPYIKPVCFPGIKYLEVDVNFSLDYKNGDENLLQNMIDAVVIKDVGEYKVHTLEDSDFFIHLCSHLYKEATTLAWVDMNRDMTLYKYLDIYMLIQEMTEAQIDELFERACEIKMDKICAFAILQMSKLFIFCNRYAVLKSEEILKDFPDFIHTVISPSDKKIFVYIEKDIEKRFFSQNRKSLLKEQ